MSYISLYRKWRSQNFDEIVGQKHIVQTLKNAILQNRIAHAYLFCGPRGTGKTSIARIFAKALNCEKGPTVSPCSTCGNCTKIRDGHAIDVIEIDAASNRGIDEIRDLREKVRYTPVECRYKLYIIDEVHMLTTEAFNALLKTLEEPPAHVIFVLATTEASRVPITIESRCQRLDFARISLDEVKTHLKKIAVSENLEIEEKALDLVARSGEGSMRDSVSLLDQLASYAGKTIGIDHVVELLGCADEALLFDMADALSIKDSSKLLNLLKEAIDKGRSSPQMLRDLIMHFRNILFIKFDAASSLELTKEYLERLNKQAGNFSVPDVKKIIQALSRTELDMKWHPNARLVLEVGLIDLLGEDDVASNVQKNNVVDAKQEVSLKQETKIEQYQKIDLNLENKDFIIIKSKWDELLDKVKKKSLYGFVSLHEGDPVQISESGKLVISFRKGYSFHKDRLEDIKNKQVVEDTIKEITGKDIKIECVVDVGLRQNKPQVTVDAVKNMFEGEFV